MAGFFTYGDDNKAVEELLSQAMDMVALEQLAAINSSAFKHSALPSHLETRFQNLKRNHASPPLSLPTKSLNLPRTSNIKKGVASKETENDNPIWPENGKVAGKNRHERLEEYRRGMVAKFSTKCPKEIGHADKNPRTGFSSRARYLSPPAKTGCFFVCSFSKVKGKRNS
ncbi:Unknown protein [Striga hermonthica]|uniref:Uncharacterized protein n=1 Tax=Striga hermonthica TaxID=68872 RepID=A0A9N7NJH0_STRHE|nr:Unknown protein [Striga hermonthica]